MGMFLSLTAVVGKSQKQVAESLANYAKAAGGDLQKEYEQGFNTDHDNCCVIEEVDNNTTIFHPYGYFEWEKSSAFISKELNAPIFSFHIHDSDFWMYVLYVNGHVADQFNPMPDYWDENISEFDMSSWKGDAEIIAGYIPGAIVKDLEHYLVRWDGEESKAYPDDEYGKEEWQLLDFMRKLKLPYPLDEEMQPKAQTYKLWTKQLKLKN